MNRLWLLLFLCTLLVFVSLYSASNATRLRILRSRLKTDRTQRIEDVPYDENPSVVFKPMFMADNLYV